MRTVDSSFTLEVRFHLYPVYQYLSFGSGVINLKHKIFGVSIDPTAPFKMC